MFGERLQKSPCLLQAVGQCGCSGCWTTGLHKGIPTSPARSTGEQEAQQGTTAVPRRAKRAQLHRLGTTELWLCLAFRFGLLWLQTGLGFERSLSPALCAETSSKSTEAMHAAAAEKRRHRVLNCNCSRRVRRTTCAYRTLSESC